jgi:hypothetical protein
VDRAGRPPGLGVSQFGTAERGRGFCVALLMKRSDFAFLVGLMVTVFTTLEAPGGLFASFVIGTASGVLAVGITTMIFELRDRR